jgi:hypothetical protein
MRSPQCADTGAIDLIGNFGRRAPERHDRITDKLVDCSRFLGERTDDDLEIR